MKSTVSIDIRQQRTTNTLIGLCVTLALLFAAFELTRGDANAQCVDEIIHDFKTEEDMVPITIQENPQPAAPVVTNNVTPDIIEIVIDDIELNEEKIETTEETEKIVISTHGNGVPTHFVPSAASGPVIDYVEEDIIVDVAEKMAEFPGGDQACYKWLSEHIKYPVPCQEQNIQGRVFVSFVVNKDGSIVDVKVMRSPDERLSKEAERVVKLMPKWKPARQGSKTVRSRFNLPVMFRLD